MTTTTKGALPAIWPRRFRVLSSGAGRISVRVDVRTLLVTLVLALATVLLSVWSLGVGSADGTSLSLERVIGAFTGTESEVVRSSSRGDCRGYSSRSSGEPPSR